MNILLFVFSMLAVLSILTTARLQSYLDSSEVRHHYLQYMQEMERAQILKRAHKLYNENTVSTYAKSGGHKLNGKLDFSLFLTPSRNENEQYILFYRVAVNLFNLLLEESGMGESILIALTDSVEEEIKSLDAFTKFELNLSQDDPLSHVFCRLKAGFYEGTEPLSRYISFGKRESKLSIYLATPVLLHAIFDDDYAVAQILDEREEIYLNFQDDQDYRLLSAERLKSLVSSHPMYHYFDFDISGTDPRR